MKKLTIIIGLALAGITYAQDSTVVTNTDNVVTNPPVVDANTNAPDNVVTNPPVVDVTTNAPVAPTIVVTTITNVTSRVQPIKLTADQMDGIIQLVQSSGVSANVPITSTNLAGLSVAKIGDGFVVNIRLK
jgi:hypothetical protein